MEEEDTTVYYRKPLNLCSVAWNRGKKMNISCLLLFSCVFTIVKCWRPVLYLPGIIDESPGGIGTCATIMLAHPGTVCVVLQPGTAALSTIDMWTQVKWYRDQMLPFFKKYPGGVNVVAYSQGTLTGRAIIETTPNHVIKTFISMAGPLNVPLSNQNILKLTNPNNLTRSAFSEYATIMLYRHRPSYRFSGSILARLVRNPTMEDVFLNKSVFLPYINNLKNHANYTDYRNNFLKLNKCVLLAGEVDEIIIPRESERGDYYDKDLNIVPLKQQNIYVNDTFGMRTMDERGGLVITNIPDAYHASFALNMSRSRTSYYFNLLVSVF
uniref:palmitoyl-CoA hydrolase n=1 Tax=Strigamia maritima TaxID=126957 RepID=T1IZX5_STRMM